MAMQTTHVLGNLPVLAVVLATLLPGCAGGVPDPVDVPRASHAANAQFGGLRGCFTMRELGTGATVEYGDEECDVRASPASTFKIPNALIGLDTGVLKDETTVIPWDGIERRNKNWSRDHSLATAMWYSSVPYFQVVAERVGVERYRAYLPAFQYGNADSSGELTMFWINGTLQVSPREETRFLAALYEGRLPVSERAASAVKRILELRGEAVEHVRDRLPFVDRIPEGVVMSGKTGSYIPDDRSSLGPLDVVGWFVGAIQKEGRSYVFACRIRSGDTKKLGPEAARIAYEILRDEHFL
jgi:beta-lactamase class D